ncbi:MAG: DUF4012 domain-containing protein [Patescibacteria group bacterium]
MKNSLLYVLSFASKLLKYGLIIAVILLVVIIILLSTSYNNFKSAYNIGLIGKTQLTEAINQVKLKNWDQAQKNSEEASQSFNNSLESLEATKKNIVIKQITFFENQVNELEYLFKTTEILSRSLERSIPLVKELSRIRSGAAGENFTNLNEKEKTEFLKLIYESEPELNGLKANLNLALLNIKKIDRISILWPVYSQISEYKLQLQEASDLMTNLAPLAKILPTLGGYPTESNLLILLQNNDELRPTGGFIGVYGLAKTKNGDIISLNTDDSYHLDMPAVGKWIKEPPVPIKKYLGVENWYLRDSNWVPDWSLAAQKINEIYAGESVAIGQTAPNFSSIIGINPDFIIDLIKIVGPIKIKEETYTAENFQELLQYNVEVAYKDRNISSWNRKDVINELLNELKLRLFNLPAKQWPDLIKTINANIAEKNIQIYFANQSLQSLVKEIGASGEVKQTNKDFLMVVDANLAAFKSDAVVKKKVTYNINQKNNNTTASLVLNYRHEGDFNWRTTRYRSYTRIYAPFGSYLITSSGLDSDKADWSTLDDPILNKTIFGFFFTVEPGTEKEISLTYSLPDYINEQINSNNYELLIQKQSGRRTEELKVNYNPQKKASKNWSSDLNTDKIFK